ncbi:LLM class flavin-dependent oxidoreductase [Cellulomonas sp. KRMCY2]|uniref:LLM class flavin-dependent oxidoreductase n=1 Tax=Cellulomonas sp. KRMCY2 TaxID=1304865 RepID=UPI00045EBF51|nr:LLM class flavin-dependent oxidoreductase [Cellulomonas sp. KRMCY2]
MRFGFVASHGSAHEVVAMAQEAEACGWDGFFTWDGISIGPMDTWDPWAVLAAVAVRTERIRLGAMVFPLARRRPWKVAREALTVDHLSGGRLVLPVGLGATEDGGFSHVGGEAGTYRERAARLDEALAILDLAWTGEPFSYAGTHHTVTDLVIAPRPVQRPRIPVWTVGVWPYERSMARAARWDGIVLQQRGTEAEFPPDDVAAAVEWLGRRRAEGSVDAVSPPTGAVFDVVLQGRLSDDADAAAEHLRPYARAGATWWVESRWDDRDTPESLLARIRQGPPVL